MHAASSGSLCIWAKPSSSCLWHTLTCRCLSRWNSHFPTFHIQHYCCLGSSTFHSLSFQSDFTLTHDLRLTWQGCALCWAHSSRFYCYWHWLWPTRCFFQAVQHQLQRQEFRITNYTVSHLSPLSLLPPLHSLSLFLLFGRSDGNGAIN